MNTPSRTALAVGLAGALVVAAGIGPVRAADTDFAIWNENWAPGPWGPDDKAGSVNHVNPDTIKRALSMVKQFKHATIGKPYASDVAFFGPRSFSMTIPGTPTGGPFGKNNLIYHDEFVTTELGQVSTQFDGPAHIGVRPDPDDPTSDVHYNGIKRVDSYERGAGGRVIGMGPLGVEHVAEIGFICRGVLIDAAGLKGMDMLPIPQASDSPGVVTKADVEAALEKQGTAPIEKGDCVFLHTGWGDLWGVGESWANASQAERMERTGKFVSGEPGFGPDACEWFGDIGIMMTGGDTSANDAQPNDHGLAVPCHTGLQVRLGIWNLENLDFSKLLADGVYEFAFIWSPLKIVGGTGSPGNPVAIY